MSPGSLARLGYYFFARLIRRLFVRERGREKFLAAYAADRLAPLSSDEREALSSFSRCIACGACDVAFDKYAEVPRADLRGPSELPLALSRSLPDHDALLPWLAALSRGDVAALSRACPVDVPFERLTAIARARALSLGARERAPTEASIQRRRHDPG